MQKTRTTMMFARIRQTTEIRLRQPEHLRIRRFAPLITVFIVLLLWQIVTGLKLVEAFLVPPPVAVANKFFDVLQDGTLLNHTFITLKIVLIGLFIGVSVGVVLGYLIARMPLLENLLAPLIVVLQSTPVVAYAPLLVIWFGTGIESKVVTCALIVFFPMLMNTVTGIRSISSDLRDVMCISQATRWQMFIKLELPAAMPVLLTGLKTSATLAVIGAIVGEFITTNSGLGFLLARARGQYDTPLVFVGVFTLALLAISLYGMITLLEKRLLSWQRRHR